MPAPNPFTPSPLVEVAFGLGPYDEPLDADWVDITDYVDEVSTSRGRDSELDAYPAGSMRLTLDNTDRRFDPLNTSGPYTGDLVANVPVRLRADIAGTKYPIWRGFVDGWPAEYSEGGFERTMQVECSDALRLLGERSAHDTMVEDITALPGVGVIRRWYRFDQVVDGEQVIPDVLGTGSSDLTVYGKWDTQERIAPASARGALGIGQHTAPENTENRYVGARNVIGPFDNSPVKSDRWAIAMVVRFTEAPDLGGNPLVILSLIRFTSTGFEAPIALSVHQGGRHHPSASVCPGCLTASADTSGPGFAIVTGPGGVNDLTASSPFSGGTFNPFDGNAHSIQLVRQAARLELWADGVLVGTDDNGAAVGVFPWVEDLELRAYWPFQGVPLSVGWTFPGAVMQELIFFDSIIPGGGGFDPVSVHEALMVGMQEVTDAGTAAGNLLGRMGWSPLYRLVDGAEALVRTPANPYGRSMLEQLQVYADSEGGRLFVDRSGNVVFHAAKRFQTVATESTVQYAFSDASATSVSIDGVLRVAVDDSFVFEAAEVERDGGTPQRAGSDTPARTYTLSGLPLLNDRQALNRAERIVFLYGTPRARTDTWDVWPELDAADWPTLLGLDIGHRVSVTVTPGAVGSQIILEQHVELIEHHITPTDWVMTLNGSPVDDNVYLTWGGSSAQGWGNGVWR